MLGRLKRLWARPCRKDVERRSKGDLRAGETATEPDATTVNEIGDRSHNLIIVPGEPVDALYQIKEGGLFLSFHGLHLV